MYLQPLTWPTCQNQLCSLYIEGLTIPADSNSGNFYSEMSIFPQADTEQPMSNVVADLFPEPGTPLLLSASKMQKYREVPAVSSGKKKYMAEYSFCHFYGFLPSYTMQQQRQKCIVKT